MTLFFIVPRNSCAEVLWPLIPGRKLWTDGVDEMPDEEIDVALCHEYGWHRRFPGKHESLLITESASNRVLRAWNGAGSYIQFMTGHPEMLVSTVQAMGHDIGSAEANLKNTMALAVWQVRDNWDWLCKRFGWGEIEIPQFSEKLPELRFMDRVKTGRMTMEDRIFYTKVLQKGYRIRSM